MERNDRPEAYGVFKPVGHVIVSFPSADDAAGGLQSLMQSGFAAHDVVQYSPQEMKSQAERDIANAGVLATIGQELNLVKANRDLAERGHWFLVIDAPKDEDAERVADIARRFRASRAQKYGHLVIEELIPVGTDDRQVAESPDRGLDAQTRSGIEPGAETTRR